MYGLQIQTIKWRSFRELKTRVLLSLGTHILMFVWEWDVGAARLAELCLELVTVYLCEWMSVSSSSLCVGFHKPFFFVTVSMKQICCMEQKSRALSWGKVGLCCGYKSNRWAEAGQERGNIHRQQSARSPLLAMAPLTPLFIGRFQPFIITV